MLGTIKVVFESFCLIEPFVLSICNLSLRHVVASADRLSLETIELRFGKSYHSMIIQVRPCLCFVPFLSFLFFVPIFAVSVRRVSLTPRYTIHSRNFLGESFAS